MVNAISYVKFDAEGVLSAKIQDNLANAAYEGIAEIHFKICRRFFGSSYKVKVIAADRHGGSWLVGYVPNPHADTFLKVINSGGLVTAADWKISLGKKMNYSLHICANICTGDCAKIASQQL